jgi:hypothetical protein
LQKNLYKQINEESNNLKRKEFFWKRSSL